MEVFNHEEKWVFILFSRQLEIWLQYFDLKSLFNVL